MLAELGRGSMGVVYKARQAGVNRVVALKMVLAGSHASQEALQRFITEARAVASLQHPNIIQLFEINFQQNCPYFSMEYVEGGTLADRLGSPQPLRPAAHLVVILARAVGAAHESGIVHRDLKPANILLAAPQRSSHVERLSKELDLATDEFLYGTPKITDFGLAKHLDADVRQTESGMILGTPSYMAPEQAEGKSHDVGPAADIYALGAILYEMLTGRPPFAAESHMETVLLLFQAEPVPPSRLQPKIPRDLETICLKCLHKDPRRRYASAEALADDLQRFLHNEPILARPASLGERAWKLMRRRPALATLAASAVLAALLLVGLTLWHQVDLRSRLGQALADERQARDAEQEVSRRAKASQVRERVKGMLRTAENALAAKHWRSALAELSRTQDQAAEHAELVDLRRRIAELLAVAVRQRDDQENLQKFFAGRDRALFHATLFTGGDPAADLQATRQAALDALGLFGVSLEGLSESGTLNSARLGRVELRIDSPNYGDSEKSQIVAGCYELLIVLADTYAEPEAASAEKALSILELAAELGLTTQAYHRRRAIYLDQAGKLDEAARERMLADAQPATSPLDHFLRGQEQFRGGDVKKAIVAFQSVLQDQPEHFWASYYLALCWLKNQQPDQAVARLTSCLSQRRDFPWLYLLRAAAWSETGDFTRAEMDFDAALQTNLDDHVRYGLLINRGVMRVRQGDVPRALADLQAAVALRPERYQGYVNLAQVHLKAQQLEEAIRLLDRAILREPELAALYRMRARMQLLRKDGAAGLADLEKAIALSPDPSAPGLADDHLERARLLQQKNDHDAALQSCARALDLRPEDARAFRLRAEILLDLMRLPEALEALDSCLKHGPPDAGVFCARAALRTRLGQYAGAQTDYTRALEIQPDAATCTARGWCFLVADAPRLALPDFEQAIRLQPARGDGYAGRGFCRVLAGDVQRAVEDAETALRRGPAAPRLLYNVVRIYAQASVKVDNDPYWAQKTAPSRTDWQVKAVNTLAQALTMQPPAEALDFWQNVVLTDRALNPLRRTYAFTRLASRYGGSKVNTAQSAGLNRP